jgi:hypothetical protein
MTFLIQWEIRLEKKNKEEKRLSEMSSDDEASA